MQPSSKDQPAGNAPEQTAQPAASTVGQANKDGTTDPATDTAGQTGKKTALPFHAATPAEGGMPDVEIETVTIASAPKTEDAPKSSLQVMEKKTYALPPKARQSTDGQKASQQGDRTAVPTKAKNPDQGSVSNDKQTDRNSQSSKARQEAAIDTAKHRPAGIPNSLFNETPKRPLILFNPFQRQWFSKMRDQEVVRNISKAPGINPNTILVAAVATLVLALQGFLNCRLPNLSVDMLNSVLSWFNVPSGEWFESASISYNFQLPLALLLGGLLGSALGGLSVLSFVLLGVLVAPIFANGGGISYLSQPSFPFLAAMVLGSIYSGQLMRQAFHHKRRWKQTFFLYFAGVLSVAFTHLVAIVAMTALMALTSPFLSLAHPFANWWQWVVHLSLEPLPYDLMAASIFLWFVRYIRLSIYPALY